VSKRIRKADRRRVCPLGEVRELTRAREGSRHVGRSRRRIGQGSHFADGFEQRGKKRDARRVAPWLCRSRPRLAGLPLLLDAIDEGDAGEDEREQVGTVEPPRVRTL
jgi:hypothetical protein